MWGLNKYNFRRTNQKKNVLVLLFIFFATNSWCQNSLNESSALNTVAFELTRQDVDVTFKFDYFYHHGPAIWSELSDDEFKRVEDKLLRRIELKQGSKESIYYSFILAFAYYRVEKFPEAVGLGEDALVRARELNDPVVLYDANYTLMRIFQFAGMSDKALYYSGAALRVKEQNPGIQFHDFSLVTHAFMMFAYATESGQTAYLDSAINYLKPNFDRRAELQPFEIPEMTITYVMVLAKAKKLNEAIEAANFGYTYCNGEDSATVNHYYAARFAQQLVAFYAKCDNQDSAFYFIDQLIFLENILSDSGQTDVYYSPIDDTYMNVMSIHPIALAYRLLGKYDLAHYYLNLVLSQEFINPSLKYSFKKLQTEVFVAQNSFDDAVENYKWLLATSDTLHKQQSEQNRQSSLAHLNAQINQAKRLAELEKENQESFNQQEKQKRKFITYSFTAGSILLVVIAFLIYRRFINARRQKHLIEEQKQQVELAYHKLDEKNTEVMDSIKYAKRIQKAILPSDKTLDSNLQHYFVLYKPKDIVAGDFYWMEKFAGIDGTNETILLAVADCTGHGVPGALVSVVCNNALNRSVKEFGLSDPGKILDKTREIVISEFEKSDEDVKDGMDISMIALENENENGERFLRWAGANNPLWILKKNSAEILDIKPDKKPIGKFDNDSPYLTHQMKVEAGDVIYLFSDGYADQFGGIKQPDGKKLKTKGMKDLLLSIRHQNMSEQKKSMDLFIENWKGNFEQNDDICVIGVMI